MFRVFFGALSQTTKSIINQNIFSTQIIKQSFKIEKHFSTLLKTSIPQCNSLFRYEVAPLPSCNNVRTVTKYSLGKGKRKTVSAVLQKFYRLNWGGWIRTKCGRNKKLWKKSAARKRRLKQHVFCNATQSTLLDKMVGSYWRKPKYYVDDPYEPYHTRDEFVYTSKKPRPYFPSPEIE